MMMEKKYQARFVYFYETQIKQTFCVKTQQIRMAFPAKSVAVTYYQIKDITIIFSSRLHL